MITNKNEAKIMEKYISCDFKCKLNSTTCNPDHKLINIMCECEYKNIVHAKRIVVGPSTCICENSKYLKIITNDSVIACDEIISVMDIASTKMTNTIATNVSINSDGRKVRYEIDCYILHSLLVIILLLIITIICYHYAKHKSKQKSIDALTI